MYGVDHGVSLHTENKLRTVLWGWAGKPVDDESLEAISCLHELLGGPLGEELCSLITPAEVAALRRRVRGVLDEPVMPARPASPHSRPAFQPAGSQCRIPLSASRGHVQPAVGEAVAAHLPQGRGDPLLE